MNPVEVIIGNAPEGLIKAQKAVADFAAAECLSREVEFQLNVVMDEILSNIIKYGYEDDRTHEIRLRFEVANGILTIQVEDDGRPFDPLIVPPPDLNLPLAERPVGRLGLHFVRNLTDEAKYERIGNRNRLLFRKMLVR